MREDGGPDGEQLVRLATEYAAAHYFVTISHREWLFAVGQAATDVERELDAGHYLFITAWNPCTRALSTAENHAADQQLQERLQQAGWRHHSALGCDTHGGAVEYGWVVLDMGMAESDALAREFGQAGTLYWSRGDRVRLRMLQACPPGWNSQDCIDWVG